MATVVVSSMCPDTVVSGKIGDSRRLALTWGIWNNRACKLNRARSRLYRRQILQENMRWKALAEIYTMHSFALLGIESQKPGKPWGEKNLVQPRENWPGEAHKQPQPATQYYLRARSEECLRIRNKMLTGDFSSTPCERHAKIIGPLHRSRGIRLGEKYTKINIEKMFSWNPFSKLNFLFKFC